MKVLFVHGNPETPAIWGPLRAGLERHGIDATEALVPPGFGAPAPAGPATPEAYVAWLADEVAARDAPVHLVGHDWGAGHVLGLVAARPDLVRSWAVDCAGLVHPDHRWHDMARVWQTPGAGEEAVAAMAALTDGERSAAYQGLGLPADIADDMAAAFDDDMGRCILELYRAAVEPHGAELGERLVAAGPGRPPGLVVVATDDPYVPADLSADMARRLGARVLELTGQGHWWMVTAPDTAAAGLATFWRSIDAGSP